MKKTDAVTEAKEYLDRSEDPEVLDWFRRTPEERFLESMKLWEVFKLMGGSLDPEPDTQSPFHVPRT